MSDKLISTSDKYGVPIIIGLSLLVPAIVVVLMNLETRYNFLGIDVGTLPFFHAVLNGLTALLLGSGYAMIRQKKMVLHRNFMITAFLLSIVFLVSYVISKISNDPVSYGGDGWTVPVYYFILITHIILSGIIIPLVLFTIYRAAKGEISKHRKIAKWTFPIWMYVAITGVLVYIFMQPYY